MSEDIFNQEGDDIAARPSFTPDPFLPPEQDPNPDSDSDFDSVNDSVNDFDSVSNSPSYPAQQSHGTFLGNIPTKRTPGFSSFQPNDTPNKFATAYNPGVADNTYPSAPTPSPALGGRASTFDDDYYPGDDAQNISPETHRQPKKKKKRALIYSLIALLILLIIGGVVFFIMSSKKAKEDEQKHQVEVADAKSVIQDFVNQANEPHTFLPGDFYLSPKEMLYKANIEYVNNAIVIKTDFSKGLDNTQKFDNDDIWKKVMISAFKEVYSGEELENVVAAMEKAEANWKFVVTAPDIRRDFTLAPREIIDDDGLSTEEFLDFPVAIINAIRYHDSNFANANAERHGRDILITFIVDTIDGYVKLYNTPLVNNLLRERVKPQYEGFIEELKNFSADSHIIYRVINDNGVDANIVINREPFDITRDQIAETLYQELHMYFNSAEGLHNIHDVFGVNSQGITLERDDDEVKIIARYGYSFGYDDYEDDSSNLRNKFVDTFSDLKDVLMCYDAYSNNRIVLNIIKIDMYDNEIATKVTFGHNL